MVRLESKLCLCCKKALYFSIAISISLVVGVSRFLSGHHTMDQIVFGWLLGAWLSVNYFYFIRNLVHEHVKDLVNGCLPSSWRVYCLIAIAISAI